MTVPALRFAEFSGEWNERRLGEFLSFKNGVNADKSMYGQGEKFINVLDVIADHPITSDSIIGRVTVSDKEFEKNEVTYGDILFQRSSETREEVGQCNVYLDQKRSATFGGFVIRGKPIADLDSEFFNRLLMTQMVRREITNRSGGSTRYNVGQETLAAVTVVPAPSLPEQKKIAAFLEVVDVKIAALRARQSGLERYKRGLMQALFSQTLRFTKPDGTPFPHWEEKRLGEVATRSTSKNTKLNHMRVLTNSAVRGVVDQGDYFDKEIANAENLAGYYVLKKGDFVYNPRISSSAPVGPIKRNDLGDGVMSPLYTVFRFKKENTDFYNTFFETAVWHKYMKAVANYGARHDRMAITSGDLMNMPLLIPHPEEQQQIADALSAMDAKIAAVSGQLAQMEAFKKGLLQQMFV